MGPTPSWFWPGLLAGTAANVAFSWTFSVRAKRYHGISRFFAFESILLLFLVNVRVWFRDPFAPLQVASWLLLTASFFLAIHAVWLYLKLGAPRGEIENSTRLVVRGAYRFIRHPMYASLALLGLGIFFKRVTPPTAILAAVDLLAVYATARIEEGEMRARFGSEYEDYLRRTKRFLPFLFLFLALLLPPAAAQTSPFMRYTVIPEVSGARVTVEAVFRLTNAPVYLRDFEQLESARWSVDDEKIRVRVERSGDLVVFRDLPRFGEARAVYTLFCVMTPTPGYRKRLMGSSSFVMAREGLFLGVNGREAEDVEVTWRLPSGWSLCLGQEGNQRFSETQRTIWVAGKTAGVSNLRLGDKAFRITVLEGVTGARADYAMGILKKMFSCFREKFGDLDGNDFAMALFPRGSIGGGTALDRSLAGEDDLRVVVHEMLHWWTHPLAPAWFREGVHDYITLEVMAEQGALPPGSTKKALDAYLQERGRVVEREGRVMSLAESSAIYDARKPAGDIYAFAPLFAAGLDREIQAHNRNASLEQVFAAVCRMRPRVGERPVRHGEVDVPALILELTGYDPEPFFQKYFFVPVDNARILLK